MSIWSNLWKKSKDRRKQRKYQYNAPQHIKQKFVASHLSKELKQKYGKRSIVIKQGDKVKIVRGQHKGYTGKIEEVSVKYSKVYVAGIDVAKRDGTKTRHPIHPSNVIITELNLDDKKRNQILERKK